MLNKVEQCDLKKLKYSPLKLLVIALIKPNIDALMGQYGSGLSRKYASQIKVTIQVLLFTN